MDESTTSRVTVRPRKPISQMSEAEKRELAGEILDRLGAPPRRPAPTSGEPTQPPSPRQPGPEGEPPPPPPPVPPSAR